MMLGHQNSGPASGREDKTPAMVSIRDVSLAAGVSVASVSRALANPDRVSKKTREKVLKIAEEMGYSPNLLARGLRSQQSKLIIALVTNISNMVLSRAIKGIEKVAQEMGYAVLLGDTQNDDAVETRYIGLLSAKQADGVILLSSRQHGKVRELILGNNPQAAVVNAVACPDTTLCPTVGIDDVAAAAEMTQHLIALGHTRIAVITGPEDSPHSRERLFGYRMQLRQAGIAFDESLVIEGKFTLESGGEAADLLLELKQLPTAAFFFNDEMAIGAIQRLVSRDVRVPEDMSIAGFDDIPFAAYANPALTTIYQPAEEMGAAAMRLLHRRLNGETDLQDVILPTQLRIRQTTAPHGQTRR
jgi:LacI family repressor for deo operon, udp, cdd, tsx, nupC, and nupG